MASNLRIPSAAPSGCVEQCPDRCPQPAVRGRPKPGETGDDLSRLRGHGEGIEGEPLQQGASVSSSERCRRPGYRVWNSLAKLVTPGPLPQPSRARRRPRGRGRAASPLEIRRHHLSGRGGTTKRISSSIGRTSRLTAHIRMGQRTCSCRGPSSSSPGRQSRAYGRISP